MPWRTVGEIGTNSGIRLTADDTVAALKGHADDYDALVFSCGDAVPVFARHAGEPYNLDLMEVIREFAGRDKIVIGHCAAGMMFEKAGVASGRKLSVHPLAKAAIVQGQAVDEPSAVDGNFWTARDEGTDLDDDAPAARRIEKVAFAYSGTSRIPSLRFSAAAGFAVLDGRVSFSRRKCYLCSQTDNKVRYFLELSYSGKAYCGWQVQPGDPSVQQAVQQALSTLLRHETVVVGAGPDRYGRACLVLCGPFRCGTGGGRSGPVLLPFECRAARRHCRERSEKGPRRRACPFRRRTARV